jgi:hypothetical protein
MISLPGRFQAKRRQCHQANPIAPMSLMTYKGGSLASSQAPLGEPRIHLDDLVPTGTRFVYRLAASILIRFNAPASGGSSVDPDGHSFVLRMKAMTSAFC